MRVVLTAIVCLMLAPASSSAETYHDPAHHFSVDVPQGWEPMPAEWLQAHEQLNRAGGKSLPGTSLIGFRRQGATKLEAPYVTLMLTQENLKGVTVEQIEHAFKTGIAPGLDKSFRQNAELKMTAKPVIEFDFPRVRAIVHLKSKDVNNVRMKTLTYMNFSVDGRIDLQTSIPEDEYEEYSPTITRMANSFQIDRGYELKPASPEERRQARVKGHDNDWVTDAMIAAAVAILLALLMYWRWKVTMRAKGSLSDTAGNARRKRA